jgi:hypothetical protein
MAAKPMCLVCNVEMIRGFMTELGHYSTINLPRWSPGEPERGFLGEAKGAQRREGYKVVAYRCPTCEALRLYAPASDSAD